MPAAVAEAGLMSHQDLVRAECVALWAAERYADEVAASAQIAEYKRALKSV